MDCSKTENGWFEFKYRVNDNWEGKVHDRNCGNAPFSSVNHVAKCGAENVYHSNGQCEITGLQG